TDSTIVAERFQLGAQRAEVSGAIAGVAEPPRPSDVRDMADAVLSGIYDGDLDVALDRAAAFLRVIATGSALAADLDEDDEAASELTNRASALLATADDLRAAAELHRRG